MKDRSIKVAFSVALAYFILMLRFYLVEYYVPDFLRCSYGFPGWRG